MKLFTCLFIASIILLICGYDLYVLFAHDQEATISRVIRGWAKNYPLLMPLMAFFMGALYGHFFL